MTDPWYFEVNGQGYGPVSVNDLRQLVAAGKITAATLVRQGERGRWERADRYQGLLSAGAAFEPPPIQSPLSRQAAAPAPPPVQAPPTQSPPSRPQAAPAPPPVQEPPIARTPPSASSAPRAPTPPSVASTPLSQQIASAIPNAIPFAHEAPSTAAPAFSPRASTAGTPRGPRYDALLTVSKLYEVLAWVCLVVGSLAILIFLGFGIVVAVQAGGGAALFAIATQIGTAVFLGLYVLLLFITLRAVSQAILLAIDVEKNTCRSNELLEEIRDQFRRG